MKNIRRKKIYAFALSSVIALSLVLGNTMALTAAEDNSTLQEQINRAQNGDVITLNKDYSEEITIPNDKEITLDLNGHTLTSPTNTVIKNNGKLTLKDSAGTGKITKAAQEGDTFGIYNSGDLTILGGSIEISTIVKGVSYGVNNTNSGTLSMSGGNIYSLTTGENWAFGIFNTGKIIEISGGTIKGQIDRRTNNTFNALGISNEAPATIELISGGAISAEVNNNGKAWAIRNRGLIKEIKGGKLTAVTTGTEWAFGLWNTENGRINKISGGTFAGYIQNPANGNNALGISNHENGTPTIDLITGGAFIGQTIGPGSGFGLRSDGVVGSITGGAFKGNNSTNALFKRSGTLEIAEGYELKRGTFFRYVLPTDQYYVELVDEAENWLATYTYNAAGQVTSVLGEHAKDNYTIYNWKKDQAEKTVECTPEDLGKLKENITLYVKTTDKPVYYFLGSSVTIGHTTGGVSFADYLAQDKGWITIKKAISGTTLSDVGANNYIQRMRNHIGVNAKMDHFICQLSTNDATQNRPMGTISTSKNKNDFNTASIIGAIEYIIAYVYDTWNCPVTFYTNPHYDNEVYAKMVDALYELQKKWGIGIIDFYNYGNVEKLSPEKLSSYMSDPIHPNAEGYKWMAQVMGELLEKGITPINVETSGISGTPASSPSPAPKDSGSTGTTAAPGKSPDTGDSGLILLMLLLCLSGTFILTYVYKMRRSHN